MSKTKKSKDKEVSEDTRLLNVLESLLSRASFSGRCRLSRSKQNKGILLEETVHEFPQFSTVREAIRDFAETHGMEGF